MADEPDDLDLLTTVATEVEAALITNALQQLGIEAVASGGYTSGFKAEAPGVVKVFVKRADAERARRALHQIRDEQADIDGSQVDVGAGGPMTAPQFFGAIVRGLGLYWFVWGLAYLPLAMVGDAESAFTPVHYVAIATADMVVGVFLLFKADGIVETCYPQPKREDDD